VSRVRSIAFAPVFSCLALTAVACGGKAQAVESEFSFPLTDGSETPSTPPPRPAQGSTEAKSGDLNDAQREQLKVALRRGGEKAAQCNAVAGATVSGEGEIQVEFDGEAGKSVDAAVGAPFAGSAIESCIKRAFTNEIVVPFEGKLTVPYTLKIEAPKSDKPEKGAKGGKK
jgi:hypothetical protein